MGPWAWTFLLVLEAASVLGRQTVLSQSVQRVQPARRNLDHSAETAQPLESPGEWTTWFNIDHPGGRGDLERLDAIRFYFGEQRACARPLSLEARTTDWTLAAQTGQRVHANPRDGFWCLNHEQRPGQNCSNYTVRFLCPPGSLRRDAERIWSPWSPWSKCSAACGHTGVQTRTRACLAETVSLCSEATEEGRLCEDQPCTACDLHCPMGRPNAACDACMCEDFVLHGAVSLPGGAPATEATVHLLGKTPKPLTQTDDSGRFHVPGLCPDGRSTLKVTKVKFAPAMLTVPKTDLKEATVSAQLSRAEAPFVMTSPETKARKAGQSVSLCCKATGKPSPDKYLWYHNNSLLDPTLYNHESRLVLRDLRPEQAGEYFCKAQSDAGAAKSQVAQLTITAPDRPPCDPTPESHLIRLPHDCFQNATGSLYYDVGRCPSRPCAGPRDPALRCGDSPRHCCGLARAEDREIRCDGYTLPTRVARACGCQPCTETRSLVRGRVSAADDGEPVRFGHIYLAGSRVGLTGYAGTFTLAVPAGLERLVLTFSDRLGRFVDTTKVLPFGRRGGSVFHEVRLQRRKPPVTLDAARANVLPLGEVPGETPLAELEIPAGGFLRPDGRPFDGQVRASVTFLDPRDLRAAAAAPSDLRFLGAEGDALPLRTYGMFAADFRERDSGRPLHVAGARVRLDAAQVRTPEHLAAMRLWSLNPDTALWEDEGGLRLQRAGRRGRREERAFLVGNVEVRERRLFNLDVPEARRCFVKVRAYRSPRFLPSEQIQGVVVSVVNLEPRAGFASNPRAWGRFDSVLTGPNGACLPAFCDALAPDAYSAYFLASLGGEELEAVPSSPRLDPGAVGVPQPYLARLQYRRSDHEDARLKKTAFQISMAKPRPGAADEARGPVYAFENLRACEEAAPAAPHFRFYQIEGDRYDYNTVPFDEDDPLSWTPDYLAWWPKPMEFRACYIKVKVVGPQEVNVRSRNSGGTHRRTAGRLYGVRDVKSTRDAQQPGVSAACVEFKCAGMLYDQDRVDRTLVKVVPQGSCRRTAVNPMLQEYLTNHLPLAVNNDTGEYAMLAPLDPLGHNYGIYTVTDQDPRTAKEIALGRCFDGTSDGSSRVMKASVGVALTFNCLERQVGRQSAFQYLRSVPPARGSAGQAAVGAGSRQQRASRGGQRRLRGGEAPLRSAQRD